MTEIEYRVADLINFSSKQMPIEFDKAFQAIITDKIASAVDNEKIRVARSMFNDIQDTDESEEDDNGETA